MSPVDEMQSSTVKSNAVSEQEKAEIGQGLMGDLNMSLRSSTTKVHLDRLQLFSLSSFWLLLCVAGSIFFYTTRINLECTVGGETVYGQKCTSSFILFGYPSFGSLWDYTPESFIASGIFPLFEYPFLVYIFLMKKQIDLDLEHESSSPITVALHQILFGVKVALLALSRYNFVVEVDDEPIPIFGGAIQPESAHYAGFFSLFTCLTLVSFESAFYLLNREQSLCGLSKRLSTTILRIYLALIAIFVVLEVSWAIIMFVDSESWFKGKFPQVCEYAIFLLATGAPILYLSLNMIKGISGRKVIITFRFDE